jgi:alkylated DNA repair dioxygenase AlkB
MNEIPGLTYVRDYLTPSEQAACLIAIDQQPWLTDLKRRVQHYGYRYDYKSRSVDTSMYLGALPSWIMSLAERLHTDGFIGVVPDQVIINEYHPGQGIADHVDCLPCFGDTILSISLGSACVMNFTSIRTKQVIPILLEPGSLVVMQAESRTFWKHGISARKTDEYGGWTIVRRRRISMTLREVIVKNT